MKKVLLAGVAAVSLVASGAAFAADLPSRQIEPIAPVVAPIFSWTGFYVGVNAGYAWNSNNSDRVFNGTYFVNSSNSNDGGFTGGGQIGYNYQFGQFVAGVEADINYADLKKNSNVALAIDPSAGYLGASDQGIEWFGTVRARLGFAIDRALIYATGGFAYGGGGNGHGFYYDGFFYENNRSTRTGWTLGGGLEYAFTDNITARVEGLYINLGKEDRNHFLPTAYHNRNDTEIGVVRAGLNYKFNSF
ncbi:outer membrane protein [Pseudochelatococcus contaminans]|uniref:Outer membrane immunogenic protein n=1 Tax=Pseudochelatococcus contaminans TaxID=1538103 RepID=A0A7W5Z4F1_9HYPH|nr:outer membrane protein [Pseudochelatococcus contaminans]MBB3809356.1 outer membrane immunogenic protein [Pseudochelatococcus contaminans]